MRSQPQQSRGRAVWDTHVCTTAPRPSLWGSRFGIRPYHPLAKGQALHLPSHLILSGFSDFQLTDKEPGHLATLEEADRITAWSWCSSSWKSRKPGSTATLWKGLMGVTASSWSISGHSLGGWGREAPCPGGGRQDDTVGPACSAPACPPAVGLSRS